MREDVDAFRYPACTCEACRPRYGDQQVIESWYYLTEQERNSIMSDAFNEADQTVVEPVEQEVCFYCERDGDDGDPDYDVAVTVAYYMDEEAAKQQLITRYGYLEEDISPRRIQNMMQMPLWKTVHRMACDDHTLICEFCDIRYAQGSRDTDLEGEAVPNARGVAFDWNHMDRLCRSCSASARECDECGALCSGGELRTYAHNYSWCDTCIDENCEYCEHCDTYQLDDHRCPYAPQASINGNCIESYTYRPRPVFRSINEIDGDLSSAAALREVPFMGFELEVEIGECRNSTSDVLTRLDEAFDGNAYYKHDGSLSNGFEIVTHPMTLAAHHKLIDWSFCQSLTSMGVRSWQPGTCGLHVHISRSSFRSLTHLALFQFLILHNETQFQYFAGRSSSEWAKFDGVSKNVIPEMKGKPYYNRGRYEAVNVTNSSTVEIRIFRGSLKPERVKMALELVNACWLYTSTMGSNAYINGSCNFARFAEFVADKEEYANLNGYIAAMPAPIRMAK